MTSENDYVGLTQDQGMVGASSDPSWSQYVTCNIDEGSYGIEITKVRDIEGWSEPTELPDAPHAMRGVLNLRARFGRGETQAS